MRIKSRITLFFVTLGLTYVAIQGFLHRIKNEPITTNTIERTQK